MGRHRPDPCDDVAARRLTGVEAEIRAAFGLVPAPLAMHSPVPELLAAVWAALRETVVVERHLPRAVKEAMAVAVSTANRCAYCVDAHAVALHSTGAGDLEIALRRGRLDRLDPLARDLVRWAASGALPATARSAPCPPAALPEALGTVLCFHYVNRMVTILLGPTLLPFGSSPLRPAALRAAGVVLGRRIQKSGGNPTAVSPPVAPGLPPDVGWAAAVPAIAAAFAELEAAVDKAASFLAPGTRAQLDRELARWDGAEPPLGTAWLDDGAAEMPEAQHVAFRLMLLAAVAPHRVRPDDLDGFRAHWPGDAGLVAVLAYGSFAAARRISGWWQASMSEIVEA